MSELKLSKIIEPYQIKIEAAIKQEIPLMGSDTQLRKACEYALLNGGKRFRPALVFMIAKALGNKFDVTQAALAIEFFHTASLIADDLPCMDNDDFRRDHPSLHMAYGETTALLASYALISAGYAAIAKNAAIMKENSLVCMLALEYATHNTGIHGATGGQFLDIFPPNLSLETLYETIHKKTSTLFEISFVLGWLFGGGEPSEEKLNLVRKMASHFGLAFQIADDFGDMQQDAENNRQVNLATVLGKEKAFEIFNREVEGYLQSIGELQLTGEELPGLAAILVKKARV